MAQAELNEIIKLRKDFAKQFEENRKEHAELRKDLAKQNDEIRRDVAKQFLRLDQRFDGVEREIHSLHDKFDKLQSSVDHVVGNYDNLVDENAASSYVQAKLSDQVDDHENRITSLELLKKAT
jgi:archaellum component FlaC